jgi:hypothetical protein
LWGDGGRDGKKKKKEGERRARQWQGWTVVEESRRGEARSRGREFRVPLAVHLPGQPTRVVSADAAITKVGMLLDVIYAGLHPLV